MLLSSPLLAQESNPQIDYIGFLRISEEVLPYRQSRLLPREEFLCKAAEEGALLLDTRSAIAFRFGHIEGAVNLPFSAFTDAKLREVIGDNLDRPIYIYCNNNFSDSAFPIATKKAELALNIPTFINLYGYGYQNIYERDGFMKTSDVNWVSLSDNKPAA